MYSVYVDNSKSYRAIGNGSCPNALITMTDHQAEHDEPAKSRSQLRAGQQKAELVLPRRRTTTGPIQDPVDYASFLCGLAAGVVQAGLFNPYDRALYLSVREKKHRPFFHSHNWRSPYRGFWQSLGGRAVSGGLYFPVEHWFLRYMDPYESVAGYNFVAGTAAGAVNACLLNPLSAIKYKTWGQRDATRGMWRTAIRMLRKSSESPMRPFFNGLLPTLYRDVVFGGCYTWLRLQIQYWFDLQPNQQWMGNLVAAALGTVASGPFNYVRNVQYATSSRIKADGTAQVLRNLARETSAQPTVLLRCSFLQSRLRIGWGTARVAFGMAFGHAVYDWLHARTKHLVS